MKDGHKRELAKKTRLAELIRVHRDHELQAATR